MTRIASVSGDKEFMSVVVQSVQKIFLSVTDVNLICLALFCFVFFVLFFLFCFVFKTIY